MSEVKLNSGAIDLGIVTHNIDKMIAFYSDTLGFKKIGEVPFPGLGVVNKLDCGKSQIKILALEEPPKHENVTGDFTTSSGFRYCSLNLNNLKDVVDSCVSADVQVVNDPMEIRPKVWVAIIKEPDGNLIELMQDGSAE